MSDQRTVDEVLDELMGVIGASDHGFEKVECKADEWADRFRDAVAAERENGGPRPRWER